VSAARRTSRRPAAPRRATSRRAVGVAARPDARELMRLALQARRASHSPYSRFPVGAALLARSGRVHLGCNVENASYGLTCCAERTALFRAVAEGDREFEAIAVTAREGAGAPPCGACRQVLAEFAPELWVHWRDGRGRIQSRRLSELLPDQFHFRGPARRRR
jgi:cytidine deaminase